MARCKKCGAEIPEGKELCAECEQLNNESYLDSLLHTVASDDQITQEAENAKKIRLEKMRARFDADREKKLRHSEAQKESDETALPEQSRPESVPLDEDRPLEQPVLESALSNEVMPPEQAASDSAVPDGGQNVSYLPLEQEGNGQPSSEENSPAENFLETENYLQADDAGTEQPLPEAEQPSPEESIGISGELQASLEEQPLPEAEQPSPEESIGISGELQASLKEQPLPEAEQPSPEESIGISGELQASLEEQPLPESEQPSPEEKREDQEDTPRAESEPASGADFMEEKEDFMEGKEERGQDKYMLSPEEEAAFELDAPDDFIGSGAWEERDYDIFGDDAVSDSEFDRMLQDIADTGKLPSGREDGFGNHALSGSAEKTGDTSESAGHTGEAGAMSEPVGYTAETNAVSESAGHTGEAAGASGLAGRYGEEEVPTDAAAVRSEAAAARDDSVQEDFVPELDDTFESESLLKGAAADEDDLLGGMDLDIDALLAMDEAKESGLSPEDMESLLAEPMNAEDGMKERNASGLEDWDEMPGAEEKNMTMPENEAENTQFNGDAEPQDDILDLINSLYNSEELPPDEAEHGAQDERYGTEDDLERSSRTEDMNDIFADGMDAMAGDALAAVPGVGAENAGEEGAGKKKKRKKKKEKDGRPGIWQRVFGNIKTERTEEEIAQMKEKIIADAEAKDAAEEAKRRKAAAEKEEKKKKAAEKKAAALKKKQEDAKKKAEAAKLKKDEKEKRKQEVQNLIDAIDEDEGRINPVGASIIFVLFAVIAAVVLIGTNSFAYSQSMANAQESFEYQHYNEAYEEIAGIDNVKEEDETFVLKVMTVMYTYKQLNSFENYYELGQYPQALDSLLKGLQRYDKYSALATIIDIEKDMDFVRGEILNRLEEVYSLTEEEAVELISMSDHEAYTQKVYEIAGRVAQKQADAASQEQ